MPDLTVITPVFYDNIDKPVFFVANRGHHADIGGISPGSMPPSSHFLWEEGARFKSFKMVDRGEFREDALIAELNAPGHSLREHSSDKTAEEFCHFFTRDFL